MKVLTQFRWAGHVRELEHEVRRLAHLCPDGAAIDSSLLSPRLTERTAEHAGNTSDSLDIETNVRRLEERLIRRAMSEAGGNRTQATKLLGISRNGLAIKMQRLGIKG